MQLEDGEDCSFLHAGTIRHTSEQGLCPNACRQMLSTTATLVGANDIIRCIVEIEVTIPELSLTHPLRTLSSCSYAAFMYQEGMVNAIGILNEIVENFSSKGGKSIELYFKWLSGLPSNRRIGESVDSLFAHFPSELCSFI